MNWIVLVLMVCTQDSCSVIDTNLRVVSTEQEAEIRKACDASPICFEMRRGFFITAQDVPASTAPPPPPPPARGPGTRA